MDQTTANQLVRSLVQRLDADSKRPGPLYKALVSDIEREALYVLLGEAQIPDNPSQLRPAAESETDQRIDLDTSCLAAKPNDEYVVCLDFGTAKSKAFASKAVQYRDDDLSASDLIDLSIGTLDGDPDSVYTIESTVWISDDGRMFAGSRAVQLSQEWSTKGKRARLDSIKQYLTLGQMNEKTNEPLPADINPTQEALTHGQAACFFLAYLNDKVGDALVAKHLDRYTLRRFTVPAWKEDKRKEAVNAIAGHLRVSQLLADTFHGRWDDGVQIADFRAILDLCTPYSGKLNHLLDLTAQSDIGRSEPVAAGAARLLADRKFGRLLMMIDIGAGTTDFALLRILPPTLGGYVTPIIDSEAVNFAGDMIDGLLIKEILAKAEIQEEHRTDIVRALRLQGIRRLKQALFESGEITLELQTHEIVTLTKDEFINSKRVGKFVEQLNFRLKNFLNEVDASYTPLVERPVMIISGGSAKLPFLAELRSNTWTIAGTTTKFDSPRRDNPAAFAKFNETDLSQLSVAIGGAVTDVNERDVQRIYTGVLRPPILVSNTWV